MTRLPKPSGNLHRLKRLLLSVCRLAPVILLQFYFYLPLMRSVPPPERSCCSGAAGCRCSEHGTGTCCCSKAPGGSAPSCSSPCGDDGDVDQPTPEKLEFLRDQTAYRLYFGGESRPGDPPAPRFPAVFRAPPDPPPRPGIS